MVSSITSTHASCVRIWNMDMNAYEEKKIKGNEFLGFHCTPFKVQELT
jgi:hypothetical protein